MKYFQKVADGIDTIPLLLALQRNADLWDEHPERMAGPSPHREAQDIWIRYKERKTIVTEKISEEHFPVWYESYYRLPQLRPIIFGLMNRVNAEHLGGVLITKIPPGGIIYPHKDAGWHPEFYNAKLYVVLQTNDKVINRVADEQVSMKTGEAWFFNNLIEHDVVNDGSDDRITLIVCLRCEG